ARRGFARSREMINYVADVSDLPAGVPPREGAFAPVGREEFRQAVAMGEGLFVGEDPEAVAGFYAESPYVTPVGLFALNNVRDDPLRGLGVAIVDGRYADPTQIDAAMPCFRLGSLGTEVERHKRVKGMISVVFRDEEDGVALLAEASRRLRQAGLAHAAAQVP